MFSYFLITILIMTAAPAYGLEMRSKALYEKIDSIVIEVLANTGAPSASIAIVLDGEIAYEKAYGKARLSPASAATTKMRYAIASNTKQFVAVAILMLVEENHLSLDDKVFKWFPKLTRAKDVTIRQLLSMTAGYQDYWPQDYMPLGMFKPISPQGILDQWAKKPLDFEPGTQYQYSNTNYIIAGIIVEKISKVSLFDFLQQRVFKPLGMTSVQDFNEKALGREDATGYLRNAAGPLHLVPKEAKGWLFSAAQLAMSAHDLALWDISMINQTLLKPSSYRIMQTDVLLKNGIGTQYGLGIDVQLLDGHRLLSHGGAAIGYHTANDVYPDDKMAIVVFTNIFPGARNPETKIARRVATAIFKPPSSITNKALNLVKHIFSELQRGKIDTNILTANASSYFSKQVISDYATSLFPLGKPTKFDQIKQSLRGGLHTRVYEIKIGGKTLELTTRVLPDGKFEQFIVEVVK